MHQFQMQVSGTKVKLFQFQDNISPYYDIM